MEEFVDVIERRVVALVDLAGFTAITELFGAESALSMLDCFEAIVGRTVAPEGEVVKWIGDAAMILFDGPEAALSALGRLLPECRGEPRLPLTRTALAEGPVLRRRGDAFGAAVNLAARIGALSRPGEALATEPVALAAERQGLRVDRLGPVAIRSLAEPVPLFGLALAEAADPSWIDPVCKMHAPASGFARVEGAAPWFCSDACEAAWRRAPEAYR